MTQPRAQQVKSVNARYSVLRYAVTPGLASTSLSSGLFPYAPGGAAEDVPGRVVGTVSGTIPVLGGDTISIRVDGAPAVPVVLASTDTTVGRIVLRVNAALALPIASNVAGFLVLASNTSGAASSVEIADGTPGMLSKVGMSPGVYSGKKGPADGLVTLSQDGLGGIVPTATVDGKNVVTDGGKLVYFGTSDGGTGRALLQLTPGGVPVLGRSTLSGSNVVISYYAKMIDRVRVRSLGSFFSLLDNTNTLTLNVNNAGFTVGFPSGPYTRDQVLDQINSAYAASLGVSDTWARIDGTVPAPFSGLLGAVFNIEVDGTVHQVVFSTDAKTVADVKAAIEGQVPGVTVAGTTNATTGPYLYIRSNNPNGRTSSLRIYAGTISTEDYSDSRALSRLGLRAGYYGGCYVADQYGPDEIEIFSCYRGTGVGSHPNVTVAGSGSTLTRAGLTAGTFAPSSSPSYVPVPLPFMTANESLAQGYEVLAAYESVLEFGDVPDNADVAVQQYLAKSAGSNVYPGNHVVFVHQDGRISSGTTSRGFFDVGKPLVMSPDGILSPDAGGSQQSVDDLYGLEKIVRQIVILNGSDIVQQVLGPIVVSPTFRNPSSLSGQSPAPNMEFYADPDNVFTDPGEQRAFRVFLGPAASFLVHDNFTPGIPSALVHTVELPGNRVLTATDGPLLLADVNTVAADTTVGYVPMSSSSAGLGDQFFRMGDKLVLPALSSYSLLRSLNARHKIYVGDGTTSFGDFSGADAIGQAITFLIAAGATRCHIVVKPGTAYVETVSHSFSQFTDVIIEGEYESFDSPPPVAIVFTASAAVWTSSPRLNSVVIRNIKIVHADPSFGIMTVRSKTMKIEGCNFNAPLYVYDATLFDYRDSVSAIANGSVSASIILYYQNTAVPTGAFAMASVSVVRSTLSSSQNFPILSVVDQTTNKMVKFRTFLFEDLSVTPGNLSVTSNVIDSAYGVGLLGIVPANNAYQPTFDGGGLVFEDIIVRDVDITCGTVGTTGNYGPAALWICPRATDSAIGWDYSETSLPIGFAANIVNVTVERVDVNIAIDANFAATGFRSPPVVLAGVGIKPYNGFSRAITGGKLRVDGLNVFANGGKGGSGTAAMAQWFGNPLSFGGAQTIDSAVAGLIALSGDIMDIKNVVADGTLDMSVNSTLLLCPYHMLRFDGFSEEPRAGGAYGPPDSRVIIRDGDDAMMDIRNFYMNGNFQNSTFCSNAMILFEAISDRRVYKKFSNFYIAGFLSAGFCGIQLTTLGIYRNSYSGQGGGITIENGYIGNYGSAVEGFSIGILASASSTTHQIGNLTIREVVIDSCSSQGMYLYPGKQQYNISVEKCDIRYCGNNSVSSGFKYLAFRSDGSLPSGSAAAYIGQLNFRDNYVGYCNTNVGAYVRAQINIRDSGTFSYPNIVNFYGNQTNAHAYSWSYANITANRTTSLTTVFSSSYDYYAVRGAETGYSGQTGSYTSQGQGRLWGLDYTMIHNNCFLMSDTSNSD